MPALRIWVSVEIEVKVTVRVRLWFCPRQQLHKSMVLSAHPQSAFYLWPKFNHFRVHTGHLRTLISSVNRQIFNNNLSFTFDVNRP